MAAEKGSFNASGAAAPETPKLSVVVPALDEAESVAPLVAEIRVALDGRYVYEIVVVDDGSRDRTPAVLEELAASEAPLRAIRHPRRFGQSAAILSGIKAARAPVVATLDGDGQNDPKDIPALLEVFEKAADRERLLVAGLRRERKDSWAKRAASRIANGVRARALGDRTPDTGCGLKIFPRALFLELPRFDHMHRFLPALVLGLGGRVVSVPVNHRPRVKGATKYGVLDRLWIGVVDLLGVMWLLRRRLDGRPPEHEKDG
jgi:dolichol-phosphate mannosyltransferase